MLAEAVSLLRLMLVAVVVAGCSGGGCSSCAGTGLGPIAGGYPVTPETRVARALQLIREKKPVRYVGVIGPVAFDKNGDIVGPFRTWRIANGEITTINQMSMEDVQAVQQRLR